jgi:hypothetical protein
MVIMNYVSAIWCEFLYWCYNIWKRFRQCPAWRHHPRPMVTYILQIKLFKTFMACRCLHVNGRWTRVFQVPSCRLLRTPRCMHHARLMRSAFALGKRMSQSRCRSKSHGEAMTTSTKQPCWSHQRRRM